MNIIRLMLFLILPTPHKLALWLSNAFVYRFLEYGVFYINLRNDLARWLRIQIAKVDPGFNQQQAEKNLMEERRRANEAGMSASDPNYPRYPV